MPDDLLLRGEEEEAWREEPRKDTGKAGWQRRRRAGTVKQSAGKRREKVL